jgi:hypothetical protein
VLDSTVAANLPRIDRRHPRNPSADLREPKPEINLPTVASVEHAEPRRNGRKGPIRCGDEGLVLQPR